MRTPVRLPRRVRLQCLAARPARERVDEEAAPMAVQVLGQGGQLGKPVGAFGAGERLGSSVSVAVVGQFLLGSEGFGADRTPHDSLGVVEGNVPKKLLGSL